MQPPPPPLDLPQLKQLISEADLIVAGRIVRVRESECVKGGVPRKGVAAVLSVLKTLKGDALAGSPILIEETYPAPDLLEPPQRLSKDGLAPEKGVVGMRAGPSCYHGRYEKGGRIIVFLKDIKESCGYRPLGSGTYDRHLCEFLVETDGIKAIYFRFADDLLPYVASEDEFIGLIRLLHENGKKGTE